MRPHLKRDKPMGDFECMAADISVDHPTVVATYPAAQGIAARNNGKRRNLRPFFKLVKASYSGLLRITSATILIANA
jgi:hypothetical protein